MPTKSHKQIHIARYKLNILTYLLIYLFIYSRRSPRSGHCVSFRKYADSESRMAPYDITQTHMHMIHMFTEVYHSTFFAASFWGQVSVLTGARRCLAVVSDWTKTRSNNDVHWAMHNKCTCFPPPHTHIQTHTHTYTYMRTFARTHKLTKQT